MQRDLGLAGGYRSWLNRHVADAITTSDPERGWPHFLYANSRSVARPQPIAWPQQELFLSCVDLGFSDRAALVSFNPATGRRQLIETISTPFSSNFSMAGLPGDVGVIVAASDVNGSTAVRIHRSGHTSLAVIDSEPARRFDYAGLHNPAGTRLAFRINHGTDAGGYAMIDLTACPLNQCLLRPLAGRPVWSPDGATTLLADPASGLLLGNDQGQVIDALDPFGSRPAWLDNRRFIYFAHNHWWQGELGMPSASPLFETDESASRRADELADLIVHDVAPFPNRVGTLLLATTGGEGGTGALLTLALASGKIEPFAAFPPGLAGLESTRLASSPQSDWIEIGRGHAYQEGELDSLVVGLIPLYEPERSSLTFRDTTSVAHTGFDWSADGEWLALARGPTLQFVAPNEGYQRIVFLPADILCDRATWVNGGQTLLSGLGDTS